MPKPYASTTINAPADDVWGFVRDFANLAEWHPGIGDSEVEQSQPADKVGCVRRLTLRDGGVVRERLLALDDVDRCYTYEFVDSPFPVRSYRSTIRVAPVTDSGQTFLEWWAWYDADAKDEEQMTKTFAEDNYAVALAELSGLFERRAAARER